MRWIWTAVLLIGIVSGCANVSRFEKGALVAHGELLNSAHEPLYYSIFVDGSREIDAHIMDVFLKLTPDATPVKLSELSPELVAKYLPKFGVIELDASAISSDPSVVEAYINDPLIFHGKTPARLAAEILKAMMRVSAEAEKITLPLIIVQGSKDKLVDPGGAQMLYKKAGSRDKTIKVYEGLYHEIHNEPERSIMFKDVEDWLAARV